MLINHLYIRERCTNIQFSKSHTITMSVGNSWSGKYITITKDIWHPIRQGRISSYSRSGRH